MVSDIKKDRSEIENISVIHKSTHKLNRCNSIAVISQHFKGWFAQFTINALQSIIFQSFSSNAGNNHVYLECVFIRFNSCLLRWLVGCFGFNGPLRLYFSLYRAVSQRAEEREERIDESKNIQTTPTRTYCKRNRPLPYCNQNCRTPRHWKFTQRHRTTRPPLVSEEIEVLITHSNMTLTFFPLSE